MNNSKAQLPLPPPGKMLKQPEKAIRDFAEKYACQMIRVKETGEIARLIGFASYGVCLENGIRHKVFGENFSPDNVQWPYQVGGVWYFTCDACPGRFYSIDKLEPLNE